MYRRGLILALAGVVWSVVACAQSGPPLLNGSPAITNVDATFRNVGVKSTTNGQCLTTSGPYHRITSTGAGCGGGAGGGFSGAGTGLTSSGGGTIVSLTVPVTAPLGGTGNTSNTAHGFMLGEGTSALTPLVCTTSTLPFGVTSSDPICRAIANADLPTSGVTAGTYTLSTITVNAQGIITSASTGTGSGSVTSVAMTVPSILAVSGSPITTSGTLGVTLANESANTVLAGPSSGGATTPTFRSLVAADLPSVEMFMRMDDTGVVTPSNSRVSDSLVTTASIRIDNCTWSWAGWSGCSTFPSYNFVGPSGTIAAATVTGSQTTDHTAGLDNTKVNNAAGLFDLEVSGTPAGCAQSAGLSRVVVQCEYHMN